MFAVVSLYCRFQDRRLGAECSAHERQIVQVEKLLQPPCLLGFERLEAFVSGEDRSVNVCLGVRSRNEKRFVL
jgi:hypothetical protein